MPDGGLIGKTIGNYRIEQMLGQGGMAAVYRATELSLQRQVAVKVMHPHLASQKAFQERFLQEAQTSASLDHPNIIRVLYFGEQAGELFIVMEMVTGGNLRKYIKQLHEDGLFVNYSEAIEVIRQLTSAVDYAHNRGMVHRDIKPDNVVLKPDTTAGNRINYRPILTDFGLARLTSAEGDDAPTDQQPIGTYPYMSPEQCLGNDVDVRTDIYALGVMLFELAAGRLPFNPKTIGEAVRMHTGEPVPKPSTLRRSFPSNLEQVILKCLEKQPADRFQTAAELIEALDKLQKPLRPEAAVTTAEVRAIERATPEEFATDLTTAIMQPDSAPRPESVPIVLSEASGEMKFDRLVFFGREDVIIANLEDDVTTIGRDFDQTVTLNSHYVSRRHARLERKPNGKYYIIDNNSSNGIWVDDRRLNPNTPVILKPDALVRIADYWVRLEIKPIKEEERAEDQPEAGHAAGRVAVSAPARGMPDISTDMARAAELGAQTQPMGIPPREMPKFEPPSLTPQQFSYNRLVIYQANSAPRVVLLNRDGFTIGRASMNDIVLDGKWVTRRHAYIEQTADGKVTIMDIGSTNGVWVDNERIALNTPFTLTPARTVRIGSFWIKFELAASLVQAEIEEAAAEIIDDTIDTVQMVKPLDADMPHFSPPPKPQAIAAVDHLLFFSEDHPLKLIKLDKEIMHIGRASDQDVILSGKRVSRKHLRLEITRSGDVFLTDLSSKNGTWIADTLLVPNTRVRWAPHELIRIGNYWMKYERGQGAFDPFANVGMQDPRGLIGKMISNYRIDRFLGQSALAATYKATELPLERPVALKVMHPNVALDPSMKQRFLEEARMLSRLDHPNVVQVLSYNNVDNELFMVMELITGGSLRGYINRIRDRGKLMEIVDAVNMIIQMAEGLHYAHQQGLIHRDIKPENVTLKPTAVVGPVVTYSPVLTDFTVARFSESSDIFDTDEPETSYAYMSPEQLQGQRTDIRSDLYELGSILYEMLIGHPPFQPRSIAEAVRMHTREQVQAPGDIRPEIPDNIEKTILKVLDKNPNNRHQTAIELSRELQREVAALSGDGAISTGGAGVGVHDPYKTQILDAPLPAQIPLRTRPPLPETFEDIRYDRVVFFSEEHPTRAFELAKDVLTVGRGADQDLILESDKVSRRHIRIERSLDNVYRIIDIGSRNGSWLGNYRLLHNVGEIWEPAETVRIGDYWARIELADDLREYARQISYKNGSGEEEYITDAGEGLPDQNGERVAPRPVLNLPPPDHDKIGVNVDQKLIRVAPGSTGTMAVEVLNLSEKVDHFTVEVMGLPPHWVTQSTQAIYLLPNNRATTSITFHPPLISTSSEGAHAFEVRVRSRAQGIEAVNIQCSLMIAPFHAFVTELYPPRIKGRGKSQLAITNTGNTFGTYNIEPRDREQAITFDLDGRQYMLEPGQMEQVLVRAYPKSRPLFGSSQTYPFEIVVTPVPVEVAGGPQTLSGELVSRARLPIWSIGLIILMLLLCGVVAFLAYSEVNRVAIANQTATVVAESTFTAATATAAVLADDDGDGLTNLREAELETFPNLADTDEDGLDDGEEVRVWLTNPLNRDTDLDGLTDGEEIALGTDPNNRDTDGDGLPDNEDPFPTFRATPTPSPYPTIPGTLGDVCPGSPIPARLSVGMRAEVEPGGVANRLRTEPSMAAEIVDFMQPGVAFIVIGGPVCDEESQLRWWEVDFNGTQGWTAEGEGEEYYLRPPGEGDEEEAVDEELRNLPPAGTVALNPALMGVQLYTNMPTDMVTQAISLTDSLQMGWIKYQADWRYLQPEEGVISPRLNEFAAHIAAAKSRGYRVLVSVAKAPDWARSTTVNDGPPDDPQHLVDFLNDLLNLAGGSIDAVEIWNEPNLRREWTGGLPFSGEGYMQLFEPAYETIRDYSTRIRIVTSGLAPTGNSSESVNDRTYLGAMYKAGLNEFNVAVGIHPYSWGNAPDAKCCPDAPQGWDEQPQFYFLHTVAVYRKIMNRYDHSDAKLWATEFGWTSWDGFNAAPPEPWMQRVSWEDQARFTLRAFEIGQSLSFMGPMFLWNLNFANETTVQSQDEKAGYSLVYTDNNNTLHQRPAFQAIMSRPKP